MYIFCCLSLGLQSVPIIKESRILLIHLFSTCTHPFQNNSGVGEKGGKREKQLWLNLLFQNETKNSFIPESWEMDLILRGSSHVWVMDSFEELIRETPFVPKTIHRHKMCVYNSRGASDLTPLRKPTHRPQDMKSSPWGLPLPATLPVPVFFRDFSAKKKILSLFGIQRKLPPTVCHPGTLAICSLSKPCASSTPVGPSRTGRFLWVWRILSSAPCPEHPLWDCLTATHTINRRQCGPERSPRFCQGML